MDKTKSQWNERSSPVWSTELWPGTRFARLLAIVPCPWCTLFMTTRQLSLLRSVKINKTMLFHPRRHHSIHLTPGVLSGGGHKVQPQASNVITLAKHISFCRAERALKISSTLGKSLLAIKQASPADHFRMPGKEKNQSRNLIIQKHAHDLSADRPSPAQPSPARSRLGNLSTGNTARL